MDLRSKVITFLVSVVLYNVTFSMFFLIYFRKNKSFWREYLRQTFFKVEFIVRHNGYLFYDYPGIGVKKSKDTLTAFIFIKIER